MEFPFGHHTHRHHRRDDDGDVDEQPGSTLPPDIYGQPPPPRPPFYGSGSVDFARPLPPPPPPPSGMYPTSLSPPPSPPRDDYASGYSSPYPPPPQKFSQGSTEYSDYPVPPPPTVEHVAHDVNESSETRHSPCPRLPSFLRRHTQQQSDSGPAADASGGGALGLGYYFANKPTYKVYCKTDPNYSLTIWDSKVILAPSDTNDPYQKWYKDEKFSTRVKDEEGFPCFSLVNKATGEAIKHSVGASQPVQLVPYNPEQLDESVLWTESKDLGNGYRTIRMVTNVRLNLDAFHGDKKSGGIHDGTPIVLWQCNKGDNQRWKITPYCKFLRRKGREKNTWGAEFRNLEVASYFQDMWFGGLLCIHVSWCCDLEYCSYLHV